ncbi:unnamed protein product [Paramecium octaurelia]|uniref:Uncharacterized protein n=1 Tax=Paramecium octaurelia TaxID=43137 RepID=A0A8S1S5W4_PAROT|nr:unnamed protein product [Paramecium octaurelia]
MPFQSSSAKLELKPKFIESKTTLTEIYIYRKISVIGQHLFVDHKGMNLKMKIDQIYIILILMNQILILYDCRIQNL